MFDDANEMIATYAAAVREATDHAIFLLDPGGVILSWNRGASRIFGYSENEIVGKPFHILFTPEEVELGIPEHELAQAKTTGRAEDRRWHLRRDGTRFFSEGMTFPVHSPAGTVVYAKIASEATERKMAETQLAALNATLKTLTEFADLDTAAPDLLSVICQQLDWQYGELWLVDDAENVVRCMQTWASASDRFDVVERLSGNRQLRRGEGLPGLVWSSGEPVWIEDLRTRTDLPRHPLFLEAAIRSGLAFPVTLRNEVTAVLVMFAHHQRATDPHIISTLAGVGAQLGLFIARKEAEDALRANEAKYRIVAETASDAIVTMTENGIVRFANPAVEKIFGWKPEELVGQPLEVLIPEQLRAAHRAGVARYVQTRKKNIPWTGVELPALHRDGRELSVEISFGELATEGEHVFTGVMRDISQRKKVEAENARLYREAQEANRAKDEFLATVSHELRTPMTAVLGWTRVLRMGADADTLAEALDAIERSATAQAQLIDDILDVSRITMGKLRFRAEPVQLREIVASAVDTVRIAATAREVTLDMDLAENLPLIMGDPARLQQVVWNLLSNALKFTPAGGHIAVTLQQWNDSAELTVRDTGEGVPAEFLPHIFERFRQAEGSSRRSHGGLGLGLAIVKHLIELHGGSVAAQSDGPGKGATFTVRLPFARDIRELGDSTVTHRLRRRSSDAATTLGDISVLLVEDDADTRAFLATLLRKSGAFVRGASSVDEALALLDEAMPDIIVSDLAMPGRDGFDLVRTIRAREHGQPRLPMLAVTASGVGRDREHALEAGFDEYLRKPVESDTLLQAIVQLVETG